jgi:hypothetical protein
MSLQTKLDNMREQFESTAPPEALTIMHRATNNLLASGFITRSTGIRRRRSLRSGSIWFLNMPGHTAQPVGLLKAKSRFRPLPLGGTMRIMVQME